MTTELRRPTPTDRRRVAEARRWFRQLGYRPITENGVTLIATPDHPDTWEANWVMAGPATSPAAVLRALDEHFAGVWQVIHVDCLTDPAVEAALALAGFNTSLTLIEMIARTVTPAHAAPGFETVRVGEAEWDRFERLVDADQREGKRTGDHDPSVAAGLIDGMRRRLTLCDYRLIVVDGVDAGYGMTVACPNGLGLIESLFTLPAHRGRGLMSGFIVDATRRLRSQGCDAIFLDAHAHDKPKQLYERLGLEPVALTRTWVRQP